MNCKTASLLLFVASVAIASPTLGSRWQWKSPIPPEVPMGTSPGGRIIGGEEAIPHSWPHQVYITYNNGWCGASLISSEWVLTAAHCLDEATFVQIILGAHNRNENEPTQQRFLSFNFILHEDFKVPNNDIALVKLPVPVEFNEYIQPVGLPSVDLPDNTMVTLTGWGKINDNSYSDVLREVEVPTISDDECNEAYPSIISNCVLCVSSAGGHGVCNGDSGGPMTHGGKIYGIANFVSGAGCEAGKPNGFARVTYHLNWIERISGVTPGMY